MIKAVTDFKHQILDSIKNGETTFLPNASPKELSAYDDPSTNQGVKGVLTWNICNPDKMVSLPAKVSLLKLNIFEEKDIDDLAKDNPAVYEAIMNDIFRDRTGIFVKAKKEIVGVRIINPKNKEWFKEIPTKYRNKYKKLGVAAWNEFAEEYLEEHGDEPVFKDVYDVKGMQVIAIPKGESIPEWLFPYIDYTTLVNTIIAPFNPVMEIFGVPLITEGKTRHGVNRATKTISNIIKF